MLSPPHFTWSYISWPDRWHAALIPLEELRDTAVRQRYDIPEDAEVFDMLDTVEREKEVRSRLLPLFLFSFFVCLPVQVDVISSMVCGRSVGRGVEAVLGRSEGEGVRGRGGAPARLTRHGQPWPRPDSEVHNMLLQHHHAISENFQFGFISDILLVLT